MVRLQVRLGEPSAALRRSCHRDRQKRSGHGARHRCRAQGGPKRPRPELTLEPATPDRHPQGDEDTPHPAFRTVMAPRDGRAPVSSELGRQRTVNTHGSEGPRGAEPRWRRMCGHPLCGGVWEDTGTQPHRPGRNPMCPPIQRKKMGVGVSQDSGGGCWLAENRASSWGGNVVGGPEREVLTLHAGSPVQGRAPSLPPIPKRECLLYNTNSCLEA